MWTAVVLLLSAAPLGPVLRQDGFQMKPPSSFRMARMDLFHGTQAGTISSAPGATRYLSAALVDGEGEDATSILISVVDAPLWMVAPDARRRYSSIQYR